MLCRQAGWNSCGPGMLDRLGLCSPIGRRMLHPQLAHAHTQMPHHSCRCARCSMRGCACQWSCLNWRSCGGRSSGGLLLFYAAVVLLLQRFFVGASALIRAKQWASKGVPTRQSNAAVAWQQAVKVFCTGVWWRWTSSCTGGGPLAAHLVVQALSRSHVLGVAFLMHSSCRREWEDATKRALGARQNTLVYLTELLTTAAEVGAEETGLAANLR